MYMYMYTVLCCHTNSGESDSDGCPLANVAEHFGFAVAGDVVCHLKIAKSTWQGARMAGWDKGEVE